MNERLQFLGIIDAECAWIFKLDDVNNGQRYFRADVSNPMTGDTFVCAVHYFNSLVDPTEFTRVVNPQMPTIYPLSETDIVTQLDAWLTNKGYTIAP